jgi:tetratricopeptide (TPR) repeat protein
MATKPKDRGIKAHLADALLDLNRIDEAVQINQQLLSINPGDSRALSAKGRILIAQRKFLDAKTALDQAIQADPRSPSTHYLLGVAESSLGLSEMAKAAFSRTLELSPGAANAAVALADLDVRTGDYDSALRLANEVLEKYPDSLPATVVAARASWAKGNLQQADAQLRAALDRDPAFLPAIEAMLDLSPSHTRLREAVDRITSLISRDPLNPKLHYLLGLGCLKQGVLDQAETSAKQAIALDRRTPNAYGLLAEISRARGALEPAVIWYQAAIEQNPLKVENFMALAGLYEKQGKFREATQAAERAHSIDPASPFIANNLAFFYLEYGGDVNVALSLAQQAKQKLPDSSIVSDTIGWAYYKLHSADAAITELSETVKKDPGNPVYHYHLGMAYIAAGRRTAAARSLEQALSVNRDFPYAANARTALNQIAKGDR